jgi:hypothetical protein
MYMKSLLSCVALASCVSAAAAGVIGVSNIGGGIVLNSGPLATNAFGNGQSNWLPESLASVHASINASGIETNGRITFLAADTSSGMAFMTLIDQQLVEGSATSGHVHMDSVANGTNLAFLKDTAGNIVVSPNGTNARLASGNFVWNSNGGGDAFAWAGLAEGNTTTFRFNSMSGEVLGLNAPATFQFLNWTGSAWEAIVIPSSLLSFSAAGDFGFAATVSVPAPSVLAFAAMPVLSSCLIRRRVR